MSSTACAVRSFTPPVAPEVKWDMLGEVTMLPIARASSPTSLAQWLDGRQALLNETLLTHGGILFRGFAVDGPDDFAEVAPRLVGKVLDYNERAAPRRSVRSGVYTSTEFPADHRIRLHHEMSYSSRWPARVAFYCEQPSATGGCTPIADARCVRRRISDETRAAFLEGGVAYVRNFGTGVDLTWQEAFQATSRAEVERYCVREGISFEWIDGERLRTRQKRQVVAEHPLTGDTVWFNHAHVFHWSSLTPDSRDALLAMFDAEDLPRNVCHADGRPMHVGQIEEINRAYDESATRFQWERGDVLLLDNLLMAHGRDPFSGSRRILVSLGEGQW